MIETTPNYALATRPQSKSRRGRKQPRTPLSRVVDLARGLRRELGVVVIYAAALGTLTLATPIAVQVLINTIAFGGLRQPVVVVSLMLAAGLSLAALFQAAQTIAVEAISRRVFVTHALDSARALAAADPKLRNERDLRRLSNQFYDVVSVEKTTWSLLFDGPTAVLQILVGITLLAFYHPILLVFGVGLTLVSLFIIFVLGRGAVPSAIRESSFKHTLAARLQEIAQYPAAFGSDNGHRLALDRVATEAHHWLDARQKHFRIVLGQMVGFWALQAGGSAILLLAGGSLVLAGQLTLGQLVAAELVMATMAASLAKIGKLLPKLYDLVSALVKLAAIKEIAKEAPGKLKTAPSGPCALQCKDLVLHSRSEPLSAPFSTEISGEISVITGSRDQLTSLRDLILCRTPRLQGEMALNQTPIELCDPGFLRDQVHLLWDHWLPGRNMFEQVQMAAPDVSIEQARDALNRVGLEPLVASWERRHLDSAKHESSQLLSEHHAALAVARALVARPKLVLCHLTFDDMPQVWQRKLLDILREETTAWNCLILSLDPKLIALTGSRALTVPPPEASQ